jgi:hypothetical protein
MIWMNIPALNVTIIAFLNAKINVEKKSHTPFFAYYAVQTKLYHIEAITYSSIH